jgi:hypothetical protein
MLFTQKNINCQAASVMAPATNVGQPLPKILPERFSSTSKPAEVSIVPVELSSLSKPNLLQQSLVIISKN